MNSLHRAAFRKGLGNSLFCSKHRAGKISSETLQHYIAENFGANTCAVIGLAVDHDDLVNYAKNIPLPTAKSSEQSPSKFYPGEIRLAKNNISFFVNHIIHIDYDIKNQISFLKSLYLKGNLISHKFKKLL